VRHPLLYEINTRCWLAELSDQAGRRLTLGDVPDDEFDFWNRSGFTHIWLMGVWTLGSRGRGWSQRCFQEREDEFRCRDIAGSPYAVCGYEVSRKLGGRKALAQFRSRLNARGIKLILDFIPNHTALDHPWVRAHPEYYVTSSERLDGTVKPYRGAKRWFALGHSGHGAPWVDTLQLDYRQPSLRAAMREALIAVAQQCDGVRCDMAMLVLNDVFARTWQHFSAPSAPAATEFWSDAIHAVRGQRREFLFLAEVYWDLESQLQDLGFDFTYDKRLYDHLLARDASRTTSYLQSLKPDFLTRSAHFIENHDEQRVASLLSWEEHRAAALLVLALPGMRFIHEGQLGGARIHANVHFARRGSELVDERVAAFYTQLFQALERSAVGRGLWKLLATLPAWQGNATHANIAVVQWQIDAQSFDIAVVNLSPVRSQCYMMLDLPPGVRWRLADLLGEEIYEREAAELAQRGLYLDLPPHAAQLFHSERIQ
jgi:glycosidase